MVEEKFQHQDEATEEKSQMVGFQSQEMSFRRWTTIYSITFHQKSIHVRLRNALSIPPDGSHQERDEPYRTLVFSTCIYLSPCTEPFFSKNPRVDIHIITSNFCSLARGRAFIALCMPGHRARAFSWPDESVLTWYFMSFDSTERPETCWRLARSSQR